MRQSRFLSFLSVAAIVCGAVIFTASCHKKKADTPEDTGYAADHALSEQTFNDAQSISDQASTVSSGSSMTYRTASGGGCAIVTKSPGSITIDFGTGCTGRDGRTRSGQIVVIYTGNYADSGSVHTITFNNFYQNGNQVAGSKTVTNMGHNSSGQPYFNVSLNGSVTKAAGGTITEVSTRVRTWTAGYNTLGDLTDDVYQITVNGTITRANGQTISVQTTAPLVVALDCNWIEAGSVKYTLPTGLTRVLDYGDTPACDQNATLTLPNGTVYNITLP